MSTTRGRKPDGDARPAIPPAPARRPHLALSGGSWNRHARLAIDRSLKPGDSPRDGASGRSSALHGDGSDGPEAVELRPNRQPPGGATGEGLEVALGETKRALGQQPVRPQPHRGGDG